MIDRFGMPRVRLLPAVMVLAAVLFAVKLAGIVQNAGAQEARGQPSPSASQFSIPRQPSATEEGETSSSEVDVLTGLSRRRSELDARARAIQTQMQLLVAAETRVDEKIASLKSLQAQLQTLLGQRDAAQQKQLEALVKTYSSMKPRDAARIFNELADDVLVPVAGQMKPDVLGAVLAQMQPEAAQKLTVKLATRLKPPSVPSVQVAAAGSAATRETAAAPADATPAPPAGGSVQHDLPSVPLGSELPIKANDAPPATAAK